VEPLTGMKADVVLDVKDLNSPMPVIKAKKAIDAMQYGQVLEVISADPATKSDISILLDRLGHELLQIKEEGGISEFYIKKNSN
jgi:tRNA 2-thiouridine synthesizing protein A